MIGFRRWLSFRGEEFLFGFFTFLAAVPTLLLIEFQMRQSRFLMNSWFRSLLRMICLTLLL